jgi:hypothetical protein
MVHYLLSKTERAYVENKDQFTKDKQRLIRYRLNKKLKQNRDAASEFRDGPNNLPLSEYDNERMVGRRRFGLLTPAMSRRYPNQARPPAQYTMKKFGAQIYVVDRLYMKTT